MSNKNMARVVVQLEAEVGKLKRDFDKVENVVKGANDNLVRSTRKAARTMESDMSKAATKISASFTKAGAAAVAAIGAGLSLNELRKTADEYRKIINILTVAGVSESQRGGVLDALTKSAQDNAVPLETLSQLYGRVSQAQTTLKTTSGELLQFTDLVSQALRVGGTSASEASGALLQMGQALSNGRVQSEEYNSMLEGAYPLLQAVASGLKEAGGDVSKLTTLVKDGKVSSEAFYRAGLAGAQVLKDKLAGAVTTSEQATQRLRTEFTLAVGKFDEAVGLTPALVKGLDSVAGSMSGIGTAAAGAVNGVQSLLDKVVSLYEANGKVLRQQGLSYQDERAARTNAARDMGTANAGGRDAVAAERAAAEVAASRKAIASFRASEAEFTNTYKPPTAAPKTVVPADKQVSLNQFKVPGAKEGGGSGSSSKEKLDAYEKELLAVEKRTKAAQLEAAMVGKSTFEKEKAKAALDLETSAKKANLTVTEEMRQKIEQSASGYATAKVKVEEVTSALNDAKEAQQFFGDAITDSLGDLIVDGEKAEDVLKNLVKQLAKAALQAALMGSGPLAGLFGTKGQNGSQGGLFGLLGGMFSSGGGLTPGSGGLYASGGYTGAGGKYQPAGTVHKGEYVFSKAAVQKAGVGNLEAMHRSLKGFSSGGPVGLSVPSVPSGMSAGRGVGSDKRTFNIDARGAQAGVAEQITAALRAYDAGFERRLAGARYDSARRTGRY